MSPPFDLKAIARAIQDPEVQERARAVLAPAPMLGMPRVLVIDDNERIGPMVAAVLRGVACVQWSTDPIAGELRAAQEEWDGVLLDLEFWGAAHGLEMARRLRHRKPTMAVQLISGYPTDDGAVTDKLDMTPERLKTWASTL